jgi:hypothetical protein
MHFSTKIHLIALADKTSGKNLLKKINLAADNIKYNPLVLVLQL